MPIKTTMTFHNTVNKNAKFATTKEPQNNQSNPENKPGGIMLPDFTT